MLRDELLELAHQLRVPALREIRRHPILEHRQAQLLEAPHRRLREPLVGEVSERVATPEGQRLSKRARRGGRVATSERRPTLLGQPLEPLQVELIRRDVDAVAGRLGDDPAVLPSRPQRLPQIGDEHL